MPDPHLKLILVAGFSYATFVVYTHQCNYLIVTDILDYISY